MAKHELLQLAATPTAASEVRQALRRACAGLSPRLLEDAMLLVSEVTSNAVLHGPASGTITVAIECDVHHLSVAVADHGPYLPSRPTHAEADDEHGRGLHLLAALATTWGVRPASTPPGKVVWFLLGDQGAARRRRANPDATG